MQVSQSQSQASNEQSINQSRPECIVSKGVTGPIGHRLEAKEEEADVEEAEAERSKGQSL
jgi:hypothetical protein